jgi:hypothetical protein
MDKPVIQALWIGKALSAVEQLCIKSFLKNGHEFHLYTYDEIANVPEGTIVKNGSEIIPFEDVFIYSTGTYSVFGDWFRWKMLYEKGNFWVDMDVICLKPFLFDEDIIFGKQRIGNYAVGVVGFPQGHEFCAFMRDIGESPNKFLPYDSKKQKLRKLMRRLRRRGRHNVAWGETGGPAGFTPAVNYFHLEHLAKPFTWFYPIPHYNWDAAFDETLANDVDLFSNTYAVHLWNDMMRHNKNFDKNAEFPKNSLFEQLKARYL